MVAKVAILPFKVLILTLIILISNLRDDRDTVGFSSFKNLLSSISSFQPLPRLPGLPRGLLGLTWLFWPGWAAVGTYSKCAQAFVGIKKSHSTVFVRGIKSKAWRDNGPEKETGEQQALISMRRIFLRKDLDAASLDDHVGDISAVIKSLSCHRDQFVHVQPLPLAQRDHNG